MSGLRYLRAQAPYLLKTIAGFIVKSKKATKIWAPLAISLKKFRLGDDWSYSFVRYKAMPKTSLEMN